MEGSGMTETTAELRMVAIFRGDIVMPVGKVATQAGHAFLSAWRSAYDRDAGTATAYANDMQTKIVLVARDLPCLEIIAAKATARGVPWAMITDAGRTVFPEPTVTALGLGPMTKTDCNALTRGLDMMP